MSNSSLQSTKQDAPVPVVAMEVANTKAKVSGGASVKAKAPKRVVKTPAVAHTKATATKKATKAGPGAVKPGAGKTQAKTQSGNELNESKEEKHRTKKPKLVRDSFTFPATDYAKIDLLKQRALKAGHEVKKSELLRAGLQVLVALSDAALVKTLGRVGKLKPGRQAK